jgi:flagellar FliJ protein
MYRFSLETVLNYRKHTEDALRKEFVAGKKELLMKEKKLARLDEVMMQNLMALQEKQRDGARVSDITLYDNYIKQISIDRREQINSIITLEDQLRQKCSELIEAMKDRKILDRLKEKELETYRRELERKERIFMSEIAVSGFNMRRQPQ